MRFGLIAIAILAGVLNPFLAGMTSSTSKALHQPIWSVAALFVLALTVTVAAGLMTGQKLPDADVITQTPWWAWAGGLFAAGYVLSATLVADKIGASAFTGITVTIAIITSIILDHFGLVGFAVQKISLLRVVGGVVMAGGLALILKF